MLIINLLFTITIYVYMTMYVLLSVIINNQQTSNIFFIVIEKSTFSSYNFLYIYHQNI